MENSPGMPMTTATSSIISVSDGEGGGVRGVGEGGGGMGVRWG